MCLATLALAGAGASAAGSVIGGVSQANAAAYQGQVAANNATTARRNAAYSASATAAQTEEAGLKARQQQGAVRTGIAANGLDVNSGSAVDVQQSQREISGLDTANVGARGAEQVYGYRTQAAGYQAQSELDQSQVAPDIIGGVLKGGGSLLANPTVDASVSSGFSSLIGKGGSGVPSSYSWMDAGPQGYEDDIGFGP